MRRSRPRECRSSTSPTAGAASGIRPRLAKAVAGVRNVDCIIKGHMPAQTTPANLKEYAEFVRDFVTTVQAG